MYTDFDLQIRMSARYSFDVTLPSDYDGSVCGFCGDRDGDGTDDLIIGPFGPCVANHDEGSVVREKLAASALASFLLLGLSSENLVL